MNAEGSMSRVVRHLFGLPTKGSDLVVLFSARLDEAGTDGRSQYAVVGGAVSYLDAWDRLEASWNHLLEIRGVGAFHWKQYQERSGDFAMWGDLKHQLFGKRLRKIIDKNTALKVTVGVDRALHTKVKRDWKGVRGFQPAQAPQTVVE